MIPLLEVGAALLFVVVCAGLVAAFCLRPEQPGGPYTVFDDAVQHVSFTATAQRMQELFKQPVERSSISIDVPRLCFKTTVVEGAETLFSGDETGRRYEQSPYAQELATRVFVETVVRRLEGAAVAARFRAAFDERFAYVETGGHGDCAVGLQAVLLTTFPESSVSVQVLKLLTQAMFAAAIQYLMPLRQRHRFHDAKSGWQITVQLAGARVVVRHEKAEVSYVPNGFAFQWTLEYEFDTAAGDLSRVVLHISPPTYQSYPAANRRSMDVLIERINRDAFFVRA